MTKYSISIDNPTEGFFFRININDQADLDLAERNIVYVMQKVRAEVAPVQAGNDSGDELEGVYVPPAESSAPNSLE